MTKTNLIQWFDFVNAMVTDLFMQLLLMSILRTLITNLTSVDLDLVNNEDSGALNMVPAHHVLREQKRMAYRAIEPVLSFFFVCVCLASYI